MGLVGSTSVVVQLLGEHRVRYMCRLKSKV